MKFARLGQELTGGKKPKVVLALTFTAKGDVQTRRLRDDLKAQGLPVAEAEVRRLNAFRDSCDSSVTRIDSREARQAAADIDALFLELLGNEIAQNLDQNETANG